MVKRKVVIDTSIIIDHLRQFKNTKTLLETILEDTQAELFISTNVIQELFAGKSSKEEEPEDEIRKILLSFKPVNITPEIAELAGQIIRDSKLTVQFADAAIAATTILNKASLFTLNKKDFRGIKSLRLL